MAELSRSGCWGCSGHEDSMALENYQKRQSRRWCINTNMRERCATCYCAAANAQHSAAFEPSQFDRPYCLLHNALTRTNVGLCDYFEASCRLILDRAHNSILRWRAVSLLDYLIGRRCSKYPWTIYRPSVTREAMERHRRSCPPYWWQRRRW